MNKILLASVALLGLAGAAVAQEAPGFYGNYEANVQNSDGSHVGSPVRSLIVSGQANATVPTADGYTIHQNDNYSGK